MFALISFAIRRHAMGEHPAWLLVGASCFLAALSGCTSRGGSESRQSAPGLNRAGVAVPTAVAVLMRRVGDGYELEIQSPSGFIDGDIEPELHIGSAVFKRCRASSTHRDYGLVWPISDSEFSALPDGSAIKVQYGPSSKFSRTYGSFSKAMVRP